MLSTEEFHELLKKFVSGSLSAAEHDFFFQAIRSGAYDAIVAQHIEAQFYKSTADQPGLPAYRSEEIIRKIMASEKQAAQLVPGRVKPMRWMRISAAAAVLAVAITLALLWRPTVSKQVFQNPIAVSTNNIEKTNNTKQPLSVQLLDGSTVLLQPGSTLRYPQAFSRQKREVFLEGEAFFKVAKQSGHPFLVYTGKIVTQVLGTSFNVRTDPQKQELEVAVRTGRVQVYEQGSVTQKAGKKGNGVLLLPNQKVIYQEESRRFIASLVDVPLPVREQKAATPEAQKDLYEETALATILPSLEARYGILIMVENETIYNCLFTGDISQQNLYTKLDIICKTLNASYEVVGTKILIHGNGCS